MGKTKKKKFKAPKPQPTGLPSVKEVEAEIDSDAIGSDAIRAAKEPSGTIADVIEKVPCLHIYSTVHKKK